MQNFIAKLLVGLLYAFIFAGITWVICAVSQISSPLSYILIGAFGVLGFILGYLHFKKALNILGEFVSEGVSQGLGRLIVNGLGVLFAGMFNNL